MKTQADATDPKLVKMLKRFKSILGGEPGKRASDAQELLEAYANNTFHFLSDRFIALMEHDRINGCDVESKEEFHRYMDTATDHGAGENTVMLKMLNDFASNQ